MLLGVATTIAVIYVFNLDTISLASATAIQVAAIALAALITPVALWIGLYLYAGSRLANQIGSTLTILVLVALVYAMHVIR